MFYIVDSKNAVIDSDKNKLKLQMICGGLNERFSCVASDDCRVVSEKELKALRGGK